jgi:hypothetical protein
MSLKRTGFLSAAVLSLALVWALPSAATDTSIAYECSVSGADAGNLSGCASGGNGTGGDTTTSVNAVKGNASGNGSCSGSNFCGVRSDVPTALVPVYITASGGTMCRWIDNSSNNAVFVPFASWNEWSQFTQHLPSGVTLVHCAAPASATGFASTLSVTPYSNCSTVSVDTPTVYGRTALSAWTPSVPHPHFICNVGSTITSNLSYLAGDLDSTASGSLSWTKVFQFSPNLSLTATDTSNSSNSSNSNITITTGHSVSLTATYAPQDSSVTLNAPVYSCAHYDSTSCSWGGASPLTPTQKTTYTIAVTDSRSLTSTASVTVDVASVGTCDTTSNGHTLTNTPTNLCTSTSSSNNSLSFTSSSLTWNWTCTPTSGGTPTSCHANLQAAQCGSNVTIDGSGNLSSGACAYGTANVTNATTGTYNCVEGSGSATSTVGCNATVATTSTCPAEWKINTVQGGASPPSPTPNEFFGLNGGPLPHMACSPSGDTGFSYAEVAGAYYTYIYGCLSPTTCGTPNQCGSGLTATSTTPPAASSLCASGNALDPAYTADGTHYGWYCQNYYPAAATISATVQCSIPVGTSVSGACGTASGQSFSSAPTTNLCASGTVNSAPSGSGPWSWGCNGSGGGSSTTATACTASVTAPSCPTLSSLSSICPGDFTAKYFYGNYPSPDQVFLVCPSAPLNTTITMANDICLCGAGVLSASDASCIGGLRVTGAQQGGGTNTSHCTWGCNDANGNEIYRCATTINDN